MSEKRAFDHLITEHAQEIFAGLESSSALSSYMLLKYEEWDQLASRSLDPAAYLDKFGNAFLFKNRSSGRGVDCYRRDVAAVDLLRKTPMLPTSFNKAKVATDAFYHAERQCFASNERLSKFLYHSFSDSELPQHHLLDVARKKIRSWLGKAPTHVDGRFGPGATLLDKGKRTTVPDKMTSRPALTSSALGFLFPWSETFWARAQSDLRGTPVFVPGNRFTTVPKDGTKDRGIAIEPSLNVFYQLGLGQLIKKRLNRAGIDLLDGQAKHRALARQASVTGEYATIDLSNASDTVCRVLVKLLLPTDWFELLDSLRSPKTFVDGKWLVLEKFSSMGNGYTFELETLVFLGLCAAAMECDGRQAEPGGNLWVYGDDMIVPADCSKLIISVLRFAGFTPNEKKTFLSGPFRESCGGDFFEGVSVRSHFFKEKSYDEPGKQIALANGLRRLGRANGSCDPLFDDLRRAWFRILHAIPSRVRACRGPEALGDTCIHDEERFWTVRWRDSIRRVKVYQGVPENGIPWEHWHSSVQLATALYGIGDGLRGITPRDSVMSYRIAWVPFS